MSLDLTLVLPELGYELPGRPPHLIQCMRHEGDNEASLAVYEDHVHCFGCGYHRKAKGFLKDIGAGRLIGELEDGDYELRSPPKPRELEDLTETFHRERPGNPEDAQVLVQAFWPNLNVLDLVRWGIKVGAYNLLVPHLDPDGHTIRGIKTRSLLPGSLGKKRAYPGSCFTTQLYRVEDRPRATTAWLVEGESDCWTLSKHFAGNPAVAVYAMPAGAMTWHDDWAKELCRHARTIVCFDNDDTGRAAAEKIIQRVPGTERFEVPPAYNDITQAYNAGLLWP